uniref:Uncharacterized protein n=1 Tax=Romanomermis culicivorax TaxID=13658 RepID=A0A915HTJ3_ROMCU
LSLAAFFTLKKKSSKYCVKNRIKKKNSPKKKQKREKRLIIFAPSRGKVFPQTNLVHLSTGNVDRNGIWINYIKLPIMIGIEQHVDVVIAHLHNLCCTVNGRFE